MGMVWAGMALWAAVASQAVGSDVVVMMDRATQRGPPVAGVVLSSDGLVMVSSDAVGYQKTVTVHLPGDETRSAKVLTVDSEAGLALINVGPISGQPTLKFHNGKPLEKGSVVTVRGVEGGLPWQNGKATVVSTQTGPWGNLVTGYLTLEGENDGTSVDVGAPLLMPDGSLAGVNVGRLKNEGAPRQLFVALTADRVRTFLQQATRGLPVARLCVTSENAGARALLDGKDRGLLPATVTGLDAGWHTLRVSAPGRAPQERLILATMEEGRCHAFALHPAAAVTFSGTVKEMLASVDGAPAVALAGSPVWLPKGDHQVRFTAKGYRISTWTGTVMGTETLNETVTLVREHGLISIVSDPPGATVMVEGKNAGVAPLKDVKLAPGRWNVSLVLPHYQETKLGVVDVRDGATVDLGQVALTPKPARITLAPGVVDSGDEVYLNGRRVNGRTWKVEPGYHDVEVRRPWHVPAKLRVFMEPDEERSVAPRPEETGAAKTRRLKLVGGAAGVVGAVALTLVAVSLVGGGAGLLVGAKLAYDRYLLNTTQPRIENLYRMSNGMLYGGLALGALSLVTVLAVAAVTAGSMYAFLSLPSDPSRTQPAVESTGAVP
jgi:hypothetical protein